MHAKNAKISASFFAQLIIAAKPLSAKLLIVLAFFVKSLFREKYESFRSLKTLIPIVGQKVIPQITSVILEDFVSLSSHKHFGFLKFKPE